MLPPIFNEHGRTNFVRDDLLQKIKEVIIGVSLSGAAISRKMVISIGNGFLKSNEPNILSEFGGDITLTNYWCLEMSYNQWSGSNAKGLLETLILPPTLS